MACDRGRDKAAADSLSGRLASCDWGCSGRYCARHLYRRPPFIPALSTPGRSKFSPFREKNTLHTCHLDGQRWPRADFSSTCWLGEACSLQPAHPMRSSRGSTKRYGRRWRTKASASACALLVRPPSTCSMQGSPNAFALTQRVMLASFNRPTSRPSGETLAAHATENRCRRV
jgi:hypothetical protein